MRNHACRFRDGTIPLLRGRLCYRHSMARQSRLAFRIVRVEQ